MADLDLSVNCEFSRMVIYDTILCLHLAQARDKDTIRTMAKAIKEKSQSFNDFCKKGSWLPINP